MCAHAGRPSPFTSVHSYQLGSQSTLNWREDTCSYRNMCGGKCGRACGNHKQAHTHPGEELNTQLVSDIGHLSQKEAIRFQIYPVWLFKSYSGLHIQIIEISCQSTPVRLPGFSCVELSGIEVPNAHSSSLKDEHGHCITNITVKFIMQHIKPLNQG